VNKKNRPQAQRIKKLKVNKEPVVVKGKRLRGLKSTVQPVWVQRIAISDG
jgi:hypothetical protein